MFRWTRSWSWDTLDLSFIADQHKQLYVPVLTPGLDISADMKAAVDRYAKLICHRGSRR